MSGSRAGILAVTVALAFAGSDSAAQASRRGGGSPGGGGRPGGGYHPGGGGRGGGSYAVPRGSGPVRPGYVPGGGVAAARHPRAGTGSYYSHGGGHYPPYYHGRYGYYRPYYYGYYPYYPYASFYFGWPYYWGGWPYYSPSYSVSYYAYPDRAWDVPPPDGPRRPADSDSALVAPRPLDPSRDEGRVRLEVRPEDASVYVDDAFRGSARETKFLNLRSGRHSIELVRPGFEVARRDVDVARGETSDVLVELNRP